MQRSMAARLSRAALTSQRGMTLIEIMVVVAIIAIVGGAVVFGVLPLFEDTKEDIAKTQLSTVGKAVQVSYLRNREYPNDLKVLVEARLLPEKQLKDPWQQDIIYNYPSSKGDGHTFDLCSKGKDQRENSEDDICFEDQ